MEWPFHTKPNERTVVGVSIGLGGSFGSFNGTMVDAFPMTWNWSLEHREVYRALELERR